MFIINVKLQTNKKIWIINKKIVYLHVAEVALVPRGFFGPADVILGLDVSLEDGPRVDVHVAKVQKH